MIDLKTCLRRSGPVILVLGILIRALRADAQIQKSCVSLRLNSGLSFSRMTLDNDQTIKAIRAYSFSPGLLYNIRLPRHHDILEAGVLFYSSKTVLRYTDDELNEKTRFRTSFRTTLMSANILFHKNVLPSEKFFYSLGAVIGYGGISGISFTDSLVSVVSGTSSGLKISLSGGLKYIFRIKNRPFGLDITYTQGLTQVFRVHIINQANLNERRYVNKGSGLHLGLCMYFGKHRKV